jgi:hypothetical protein
LAIGLTKLATALHPPLAALLAKLRRKQAEPTKHSVATDHSTLIKPWPLIAGIVFTLVAALLFQAPHILAQEKPVNLEAVWKAFKSEQWKPAISLADKYVDQFQGYADEKQEELEKAHAPQPPDVPPSEDEKQKILKQGLLNDVAACLWVKARAMQELGQKDDAKQAYQEAAKYTYARVWDPQGWFWSPAKDARMRLKRIN